MRSLVRLETSKYQLLKERILQEHADLDEVTLADTLEGITDLHEMIAAVIRSALVDEALVAGSRLRLEQMRERLSRLEFRGERKRQLAFNAMAEVDLRKLEQPDFTASLRSCAPSVVVANEVEIPAEYWTPQPPKLSRQALLSDLKGGAHVPGATLSNAKLTLSVRAK